jgi:hypothetical protein
MTRDDKIKAIAEILYNDGGGHAARGAGGRTQFYGPHEMIPQATRAYDKLVNAGVIQEGV